MTLPLLRGPYRFRTPCTRDEACEAHCTESSATRSDVAPSTAPFGDVSLTATSSFWGQPCVILFRSFRRLEQALEHRKRRVRLTINARVLCIQVRSCTSHKSRAVVTAIFDDRE